MVENESTRWSWIKIKINKKIIKTTTALRLTGRQVGKSSPATSPMSTKRTNSTRTTTPYEFIFCDGFRLSLCGQICTKTQADRGNIIQEKLSAIKWQSVSKAAQSCPFATVHCVELKWCESILGLFWFGWPRWSARARLGRPNLKKVP